MILTAGDAGLGLSYAEGREAGNEAASAEMLSVSDTYTEFYATFGGQPVLVRTLEPAPQVQKVWLRLPDGGMEGEGYSVTGYESIRSLFFGNIGTITSIDDAATFTLDSLMEALSEIIAARQPDNVRSLDYLSDYYAGDHADHLTSARLTNQVASAAGYSVAGYMGYPISGFATSYAQGSEEYNLKYNAFLAYAQYDPSECQSYEACLSAGRGEASWLLRQYIVTPELAQQDTTGAAQNQTQLPDGEDLALSATVTASSAASGQPASAAIDDVAGGYPGDSSKEWASVNGLAGTWIQLDWSTPINITQMVLYDRPNTDDWMTSFTLKFADNTSQSFGQLYNGGTGRLFTLDPPVVTDMVRLVVDSVASTTYSVGLSEWRVYGSVCEGCEIGSGSNSTGGGNGGSSSGTGNLALQATATASSSSSGQPASAAIDNVISGYPGDYTAEWASDHQGAGATLTLTWASAVTFDSVVLYDRPNTNDQILSATLLLSDSVSVPVGTLPNDGSALTLNFTAMTTGTLTLQIDSVSSTTDNVGLSEIQVFNVG